MFPIVCCGLLIMQDSGTICVERFDEVVTFCGGESGLVLIGWFNPGNISAGALLWNWLPVPANCMLKSSVSCFTCGSWVLNMLSIPAILVFTYAADWNGFCLVPGKEKTEHQWPIVETVLIVNIPTSKSPIVSVALIIIVLLFCKMYFKPWWTLPYPVHSIKEANMKFCTSICN